MSSPISRPAARLEWSPTLSGADVDDIESLLAAAEQADGSGPVSEDVRLMLRPGLPVGSGRHLLAHLPAAAPDAAEPTGRPRSVGSADDAGVSLHSVGPLVGYAHLGGPAESRQAEVVVHPAGRRRGVGRQLVTALTTACGSPSAGLDVWAHGDLPGATALARRLGFTRARVLFQLRRPLHDPLPQPTLPAGVTVRAFVPGRDDQAWLAVNATAFADHPEQGRWTVDDLARRREEPWFDPRGFFVAERAGEVVGFHWTKVHDIDATPVPGTPPALLGPIGEVYVVGVLPGSGGAGLGRALTLIGLHHLRAAGLADVLLYVDEDNERAVRMYTGLGFTEHARDVSYHWNGSGADPA
ncbi:mycothiol synthase [Frankia sp. AiPa1]|uniref:mycothiol synthase n=1 Tax=Frankia sp. AiPa1 TaxID=573492 RepID=UPI00202B62F5|nr:mycothiol synthase [Frankia sp. AiPa1]MCL9759925.1 mycothiol synthase [Frankia sp. AiPa1]